MFPDGILYASKDSHYSVFKAARMYRMECVKVNTLVSGEIDCDDFKAKLLCHKDKPAILNVNIGSSLSLSLSDLIYGSRTMLFQEQLLKELLMILIWLYRNLKKQVSHTTGSISTVMGLCLVS